MTKPDIEILKKLGKMTKELRKEVVSLAKPGVDITELIDFVETKIFEKKYLPAFPCTVSVNDMAAHYTVFDEGYILQKGDVIKIDFGISENGFITDNATTVEIETNKHEKLIKSARACLDVAMETVNVGVPMCEIGKKVYETAKKDGFNTIHNLSGHEIAQYNLHCGLSVPNYDNGDKRLVQEYQEFAIEPFVTYGEPKVKNAGGGNIMHLINDKPVRDPIAMKVLKLIREQFPKLPFSKRWLLQEVLDNNLKGKTNLKGLDKRKVLHGLRVLKMHNIVYEYEGLATVDGEMVAQFEDAVVFNGKEKIIFTRL